MKIFMTYRRQDSEWLTLSLYNELLQQNFKQEQLFKDFNTIKPGEDFIKAINNNLQSCDVLLVIIGKKWLHIEDEDGNARIFKDDDFVRIEIETALKLGKKVIPVLTDDVAMPATHELPPSIADLHRMQSVKISNINFELDVFNLANSLNEIMGNKNEYSSLIKDIATGKVSEKDLIKPENNSAYPVVCVALSLLILLLNTDNFAVAAVCFLMAVASGYAYFISRKVKELWLQKQFDAARLNARNAKWISLIATGSGIVLLIFIIVIQGLTMLNNGGLDKVKNIIDAVNKDSLEQQKAAAPDNQQQIQQTPNSADLGVYKTTVATFLYTEPSEDSKTTTPIILGSEFQALEVQDGFIQGEFKTEDGLIIKGWVLTDDAVLE